MGASDGNLNTILLTSLEDDYREPRKTALACDKRLGAADEEGSLPQGEPPQHHASLGGPLPSVIRPIE